MTWQTPGWLELVILALAAFRLWRLVGEDEIFDRPRLWFVRRTGVYGETWIECPWCAGLWIAVGVWLAFIAAPDWTVIGAVPLALSALVGLIGANLDPA